MSPNIRSTIDERVMEATSIEIFYKHVDGWHVFTSDALPGLLVASKDAQKAYNDIAPSIQQWLEIKQGIVNAKVVAEEPFEDFIRHQTKKRKPRKLGAAAAAPRTPILKNRRYAVHVG